MKFLSVVAIALSAFLVSSQAPDQCITSCATQVCGSLTNLTCFCQTGTSQLAACVESTCPPSDLTLAAQLAQVYCGTSPLFHLHIFFFS